MKKNILLLLAFLILVSCTDPYTLKTNNYEEALVIEATITNELKHQAIKISKTYRLEETAPTTVADAVVYITDNFGNSYEFQEQNDRYVSVNEFQAEPNVQYKLKIITDDGKSYSSTNETLTHITPIDNVVTNVVTKNGIKGIDIVAQSFDATKSSKYYRYEYEETSKIIAPKWVPVKAIASYTPSPGTITLEPRTYEAKTCFTTKNSDKIILTNTNDLTEDRVNYPVRFIKSTDYIIANRYSILVRQFVQNLASYTYYKTLKEISESASILSQNQPGFFNGNIKRVENPDEKVIGFFEVSSVSTKRIFFNFHDVLPLENYPKYPYKCEIDPQNNSENILRFCFSSIDVTCQGYLLLSLFYNNQAVYYASSGADEFEIYPTPCGDCTSFSSNIIPSFWID